MAPDLVVCVVFVRVQARFVRRLRPRQFAVVSAVGP